MHAATVVRYVCQQRRQLASARARAHADRRLSLSHRPARSHAMTLPRLNRRTLLRGVGGLAVGLPALEAMSRSTAAAAVTPAPKRLVVFFTPNGTNANNSELVQPDFWPEQTGASFTLGPEVAPLEPLRKQLLMVSG